MKRNIRKLPSGLINLGNSCYLSSVLQLLSAAEPILTDHFDYCGVIGQELCQVLREINEGEYPVRPLKFIKSFTGSAGFSSDQQDSHEFLLALLNLKPQKSKNKSNQSLASIASIESIKSIKFSSSQTAEHQNPSIFKVKCPFIGVSMNELICLPCAVKKRPRHISSMRIEPFSCVTLTPTGGSCSSINETVYKQLCGPERLSDYSNYLRNGDKCGLGAINQKNPLILPELLFLHVSLLSAETFMKSDQKIETNLELSGPGYRYQLLAVIVHYGSSGHGGHFICYRRHGRRGWIKCDDARVTIVDESEVLDQRGYLYLYQKE